MGQSTWRVLTVAGVVLASGCTGLPKTGTTAPIPLSRPAAQAQLTRLVGIAQAPASLVTNNGSNVIANNGSALVAPNGSSLVSNGASNARSVLAVEETAPVADAEVVALDENDRPLTGVKPVRTDAQGRFTLENVPTGGNVQVVVKKPGYSLTTIVRPAEGGKPVSVTPASTLVAAHLKKELAADKRALKKVPPSKLEELTASVEAAIANGDVPLDLTTPEQALKGYDHVMTRHPELAEKGMAAVAEAHAAAKVPDAPAPEDKIPVDPAASHRPEQAASPDGPDSSGQPPADPGASRPPQAENPPPNDNAPETPAEDRKPEGKGGKK